MPYGSHLLLVNSRLEWSTCIGHGKNITQSAINYYSIGFMEHSVSVSGLCRYVTDFAYRCQTGDHSLPACSWSAPRRLRL